MLHLRQIDLPAERRMLEPDRLSLGTTIYYWSQAARSEGWSTSTEAEAAKLRLILPPAEDADAELNDLKA
jgi:hypothetical protein